jgi:hypothetical protein
MSFLPEYLRSNKDFLVFLRLLISEFDITLDNIEKFTDLVDPDKVPIKFIEALGSVTNYRFIENADDDFNREILMRMQSIYEQRGTDKSIVMAATHGNNLGWVGGDIFIPGYDISKDTATIVVAKDSLFTHSKSRHSGTDVFADSEIFRPGVIIINLPYIDEDILDAVTEVMPAGVKYKFFLNSSFMGNDNDEEGLGEFGELSYFKSFRVVPLKDGEEESEQAATNTELSIDVTIQSENFEVAKFSTNTTGGRMRSGRLVVQEDTEVMSEIGASVLPYRLLCKNFDKSDEDEYSISPTGEKVDVKSKKGNKHLLRDISDSSQEVDLDLSSEARITACRSKSCGIRSGRGKFSGILTHTIDSRVYMREITPYDVLYYVSDVNDLKPSEFADPFYQADVEISV